MPSLKLIACSALLIILMLSAYMFLRNYVYPRTADKPFGGMMFFGIFSGVFAVVIAITYLLLRLALTSFSRAF